MLQDTKMVIEENYQYISDAFYFDTSEISKNPIFVHVGTFTGKLENKLVSLFPDCQIFSIEPHPENFKNLVKNTEHLKNVVRINKALITTEDKKTILEGNGSCATTYKTRRGIEVESFTIKNFIEDFNLKDIDCVFYNAEGSEMDFIPYIVANGIHSKMRQICLNFHVHVPHFEITYDKVDNLLKNSGIMNFYKINDDRITKVASRATGGPTSEKYPCFLFVRK